MNARIKDAFITAFVAFVLALPLAGARTMDGINGLMVEWHIVDVTIAAVMIFFGRLLLGLIEDGYALHIAPLALLSGIVIAYLPLPSHFLKIVAVAGAVGIAGRAVFIHLCHSRASGNPVNARPRVNDHRSLHLKHRRLFRSLPLAAGSPLSRG